MKTTVKMIKYCLILVFLALSAGCNTLPVFKDDKEELAERLELYGSTVRWGALEKVYVFMKPPEEGGYVDIPVGLDNIRVVDYEVTVPASKLGERKTLQSALITYVKKDEQVIKKMLDNQIWEQEKEGAPWFRTNPIPKFK